MAIDRIPGDFTSMKVENHKLSLGAAEEVTYHVRESGSDSGSSPYDIYFNFDRAATGITIRTDVAVSLTQWNGKTLKSPITINPGANKFDVWCSSVKLVSTGAAVVEVTIK